MHTGQGFWDHGPLDPRPQLGLWALFILEFCWALECGKVDLWTAALFVSALVAWAAWRAPDPAQASVLGLALVFALLSPTCYYWVMLLLLPLRQPLHSTIAYLMVMLIIYLMHPLAFAMYSTGYHEALNSPLAFGPMSMYLLIMFLYWLMPGRDLKAIGENRS